MTSGSLLTEQDLQEFLAKYGELIRQQCVLLMGDTEAAKELEEKVIASIREKYEYQPLPSHCETMLIARCCILSSRMETPEAEEEPGAGAVPGPEIPPAPAEPQDPATPPASAAGKYVDPEIPEEIRDIRITAVYDPEKTALWLPDGLEADRVHQQKDPEDPEEQGADRSVAHSIVNTFLVICFLGSVVFFLWKTGLLRWMKRTLEGLFMYG